jgi:hypothetical protein
MLRIVADVVCVLRPQEAAGSNAAGADGAPAVQPLKPRFELTTTQYVAPFTITSIGG